MRETRRLVEGRPKGPKLEARTADSGSGVLGEGAASPLPTAPLHQLGSLKERYKLPPAGSGVKPRKIWILEHYEISQIMSKRSDNV